MGHRLAPQAEIDLDSAWYYVATASGSAEIADRLIDSIASRFFLLATQPYCRVAIATRICDPAFVPFQLASTSSPIGSKATTC